LTTKFEFTRRSSLWSTESTTKYEQAPYFGRTGMGQIQFDELWNCVCFSYQQTIHLDDVSSRAYWWSLIVGFVS
jgi:hypothetical protein